MKQMWFVLSFLASANAFCAQAYCNITIFTEKSNGEKIRMTFKSKLHSEKECATLARMHKPNFTPDDIKQKVVSYQWEGPKDRPTRLALLTKPHSRRRVRRQ